MTDTIKFEAGCYVTTHGAQGAVDKFLPEDRVTKFFHGLITRHLEGDWGDSSEEDKETNDKALKSGGRLMSVYEFNGEFPTLWVITEWDRSVCTILLPSEY